jgi:hypothetical protein
LSLTTPVDLELSDLKAQLNATEIELKKIENLKARREALRNKIQEIERAKASIEAKTHQFYSDRLTRIRHEKRLPGWELIDSIGADGYHCLKHNSFVRELFWDAHLIETHPEIVDPWKARLQRSREEEELAQKEREAERAYSLTREAKAMRSPASSSS